MDNYLEKTGVRFFLLSFTGFYFILVITTLFRDALAGSESIAIGFGLMMTFLLLWGYLGSMILVPTWSLGNKRSIMAVSVLVMTLPTISIASFLIEQIMIYPLFLGTFKIPLLPVVLMTLPIGLWGGVTASVLNCDSWLFRRNLSITGLALGILCGGAVLALAVERLMMLQVLLLGVGLGLILWSAISAIKLIKEKRSRKIILLMALGLAVLNFIAIFSNGYIQRAGLTGCIPGWHHLRSVEMASGRMSFFERSEKELNDHPEYQVTLNRQQLWKFPDDVGRGTAELLSVSLQVNRSFQRILLVALPFHHGVGILEKLPQVVNVEVLYPFKTLFEFGREKDLFTPPYFKSRFINICPAEYLRRTERKFDAVIVLDCFLIKQAGAEEFVELAKKCLEPGGVFAAPLSECSELIRKHFPYNLRAPGGDGIMIGGTQPLNGDIGVLAQRFEGYRELISGSVPLPDGVFEILYSQPRCSAKFNKNETLDGWIGGVMPSGNYEFSYWLTLLLALLIGIYWLFRFWLGRYGNSGPAFGAFENGFYGAGFFYFAIVLLYWNGGAIYQMAGLLLGLCGLAVIGRVVPATRILRIIVAAISCLLPLLMFFNFGVYWGLAMTIAVGFMSISCGQTGVELENRLTLMKPASLVKWQFAGGFYGMTAMLIILLNGGNMFVCGALLMLLRSSAPAMAITAHRVQEDL